MISHKKDRVNCIIFMVFMSLNDVSIAYLENQNLSPPTGAFLENLSSDMPALGIGALMAKIRAHRDELMTT